MTVYPVVIWLLARALDEVPALRVRCKRTNLETVPLREAGSRGNRPLRLQ
jgi:hypothetical protein